MTVKELIEELEKIENKEKEILFENQCEEEEDIVGSSEYERRVILY